MSSPNPLKRTYADANPETDCLEALPTVERTQQSEQQVPALSPDSNAVNGPSRSRKSSPAPSSSSLSTLASPVKPPSISQPQTLPAKRPKPQKLPLAEKEALKLRQEIEKKRKAEETALKEEEKRIKNQQKAEEKAKKEEEKRLRLIEVETKRRAKELEKEKKERSQLRLNAFFVQPKFPQGQSGESTIQEEASPCGSRRSSISSLHDIGVSSRGRSVSATPQKASNEYEKRFPPFFLKSHTTIASWNRFERDEDRLQIVRSKLDTCLKQDWSLVERETMVLRPPHGLIHSLRIRPGKRRRKNQVSLITKSIIAQIHGTSCNPIDLTDSTLPHSQSTQTPLELLNSIPLKTLKFAEDVRPPYIGTRTQLPNGMTAGRLGRRPCKRTVSTLNYDYDSEAEWEPLGEGEDLNSEGEDDLEDDDDEDDMKDFVDDEGATEFKKRILLVNEAHTSTGLCWENTDGKSKTAAGNRDPCIDLEPLKLEMIADNPKLPIDPYSTAYWESTTKANQFTTSSIPTMDPPRVPLNPINRFNLQLPNPVPTSSSKQQKPITDGPPPKAPKRAKKFVDPDILEDFKRTVAGSDYNKNLLVEMLKKQFPKQSKPAISDTLNAVAERVGVKEADKRWVIKPEHVLCSVQGCCGTGASGCEHIAQTAKP